jgi:hypothetical protein
MKYTHVYKFNIEWYNIAKITRWLNGLANS